MHPTRRTLRLILFMRWMAVAIVAFFALASMASAAQPGGIVSPSTMQALRQASQKGLDLKAKAPAKILKAIHGTPVVQVKPHRARSHKPGVLYMGADYCLYCAALRWPLVLTLMRFGHFKNLHYMRSSSNDVYPNTITFSFHGTSYHSSYLVFQGVEMATRKHKKLEKPDKHQMALFRKFDVRPHKFGVKPYAPTAGGIPFLYLGGYYMSSGAPMSPGLLKGLSWQQAVRQIAKGKSKLGRKTLGVANLYTAAICRLTRGKPSRVCQAPGVKTADAELPIHL